jgi:hypothetical protein
MATQAEFTLHQERQGVIGGSDTGALYNLDWGCIRRLAYEKSGVKPDFEELWKPEFERGKYMEKVVAEIYADKTQRTVKLSPRKAHPERPYMVVHMDREIESPEKAGPGYLEIKVVNFRTMRKFKKEGLHHSYILQVQHGLAVTDYQWGSYAILCLEPWEFKYFDVERDEEIVQALKDKEAQFMSDIEHKIEYARLEATDKRCHVCPYRATCQAEALNGLVPQGETEGDIIERPELLPLAAELRELGIMFDDINALYDETSKQMQDAIEALATVKEDGKKTYPGGVRYPGGRTIRIQPDGSRKWDQKALWGLWDSPKATPLLKQLLGKYCKDGKKGTPPKASIRSYWTGEK